MSVAKPRHKTIIHPMLEVTGLTIDEVRKRVDPASFFKGKDYFTQGRVSNVDFDGEILTGQVEGTRLYDTSLTIENRKIIDTCCSCPIGGDCKHAVALGLTAILKDSEHEEKFQEIKSKKVQKAENAQDPKPKKSWAKELADLERTSFTVDYGESAIQLQIVMMIEEDRNSFLYDYRRFSQSSARERKYVLKLRPRIYDPITGAYSVTEVTWRYVYIGYELVKLNNKYHRMSSKATHYLELLSGAMNGKNYPAWAEIPNEKTQFVWELLKDHQRYGVELVAGKKDTVPVTIAQDLVEAFIAVDASSGGNIIVTPKVTYKERDVSQASLLIGNPARFAVIFDHFPIERWYLEGEFLLAQVEGNVRSEEPLGKKIVVPKEELEIFKEKYLLNIARRNTVKSSTPLVVVPKFVKPMVKLVVEKAGKNKIKPVLMMDNGEKGENVFYDNIEARDLLETTKQDLLTNYRIWPDSVLEGLGAATFITRTLKELENTRKLKVEVQPGMPNFFYDESKPQIEIGISQSESNDWFDLDVKVKIGNQEAPLADIISAISRGEEFVLLDSGTYFSITDPSFDKLRQLLKEAKDLQDKDPDKPGKLKISRFQVGLWDELQRLGVVSKQAKEWEETVKKLNDIKEITPQTPPKNFLGDLRAYQQEGLSWLHFLRTYKLGGILADDMGLGKTVQTISFFTCMTKKHRQGNPFLVVAPTTVIENWDSELERFAPSLKKAVFRRGDRSQTHSQIQKSDVVLISYALLVRDFDKLKTQQFDTIFLDEAQMAKNYQSKAYGLIKQLKSRSKIALTGTPMENNLLELWTLFSLVAPGLFPHLESFKENFRNPIEKNQSSEVLEKLRRRIRPFILRRKKDLVEKELPLKTIQTMFLEMPPEHKRIYDLHLNKERQRVLGLMAGDGLNKNRFDILKSLTIMRQLCLHPVLIDQKHKHIPAAKIEALAEHIELLLAEKHKVLVFSQFTGFLALAKGVLDRAGINYLYLDGTTKDRKTLINQFQNGGPSVFLISLKAGGFGLNLTEADFCIMLDPWWNPQVENQAIDRMHRIGQTKPVFVYKFIVKDTVEEKVLRLQEKKAKLFAGVLEEGNIFGGQVTAEDIKHIFS